LEQAVSLDPPFFDAYCRLAADSDMVYLIGFDHTANRLAVAEKAVNEVVRLRPNAAETHLVVASHRYRGYLDYENARKELALARKGLPNDAGLAALQGYIDRRQGRYDKAIDELLRATDLNPRDLFIYQEVAVTLLLQRHFPEMAAILDRALAIAPQHAPTRILQAYAALQRLGDTKPLHDLIEPMIAADPRVGPQLAEYWFRLACFERDVNMMEKAIAVMPPEGMAIESPRFPRAWCEALVAKMKGDVSVAHGKLFQARAEVAETVRQQPGFPVMLSVLGVIDANLGRKDLAINEGKQAVESLPLSKDSIDGFQAIKFLAIIYAWTGENDLAFEQLQLAASIPSDVSYGNLLVDPAWDPLRGDPRFDKILASLAPK
jgi:tetratricopeptide (TPR) repeat protein